MHRSNCKVFVRRLLSAAAATLLTLLNFSNNVDAFVITSTSSLAPMIESYHHAAASIPNTLTYSAAFLASFRTGAAISVINQPRMPYIDVDDACCVGSTLLRLPTGARVRLFYPANSTSEVLSSSDAHNIMADYLSDGKQTSDGMAAMVGFQQLGLSFLLRHLADASSGCIQDAPIMVDTTSQNKNNKNNNSTQLPLLIYSHGYGGNMDMATYLFRTMASKGMIVAAIEHTDGTASSTVLEDGYVRNFNEYFMTGRQQLTRRASELLEAADFLPGYIEKRFNCNSNSTTSGNGVKVGTIMLGGHSYGAPSAVMAANGASDKTNISGLILHDPALGMGYGMLPPNGAKSRIPTISYVSDEYHRDNVRYGDLTLHVKGACHGNFVDAPLWAPQLVMRPLSLVIPAAGPADAMLVHEQLAESALAFMRRLDPKCESVMRGNLFDIVRD